MKKLLSIAVLLSALLLPNLATAEDKVIEEYKFDKAHTQILFFVDHLGFSKSHGEFIDFDGSFNFDTEHPESSNVEITIDTSSIDMNDAKWNKHMKSKDFFDVEKFPTMTFKSTEIKVTDEKTADIIGDLTILDVTKQVTLAVTHNKSGMHAFSGKYISGFSAHATLKRSDFGMKYGLPMVGDDIELRIQVEGVRQEAVSKNLNK